MIEAPSADAVTVARPPGVLGEGLAVYNDGALVGIWRPKEAAFALLERIHDHPQEPETWSSARQTGL